MAIQVSSIAELEMVMMQQVQEAMNNTSQWLINEVKDVVDKTVYDAYTPDVYDRTDTLINSIDITDTQDGYRYYSMTVGHQPSYWHSIGQGAIDYVPQIVHSGKVGTYEGMGENQHGEFVYHHIDPRGKAYGRPRPYMDKAVKSLKTGNKYLRHLVANIGNGARIG
jgi:hypothetical protein